MGRRAIRAANIPELFYPQTLAAYGYEDPCAGPEPAASVEECERTGVPAEMYGQVLESPSTFYNELGGGNPTLDPEVADTLTAGVVWTPEAIRGLSVTVDYYNIAIEEAIGDIGAGGLLNLCTMTGEARYCDRIHRDEQLTLWMTERAYVDGTNQNYFDETREGVDLTFNYLLGLGGAGYLAMDLMGSFLVQSRFADPFVDFDCTGYFGGTCGFPSPNWRHRFRATWESDFRLNLSLAWRYMHSVEIKLANPNPQLGDPDWLLEYEAVDLATIPAYNWFDFAASYTMRNGLTFTVGVNNIVDKEPELYWEGYGQFDPLGRYIFGSVQFNF